jgi:hypothetical protein
MSGRRGIAKQKQVTAEAQSNHVLLKLAGLEVILREAIAATPDQTLAQLRQ